MNTQVFPGLQFTKGRILLQDSFFSFTDILDIVHCHIIFEDMFYIHGIR